MVKKVKRVSKPVFFVVFLLIAAFTLSVIFGFSSFYGDNETVYIKGCLLYTSPSPRDTR